MAMHEDDDTTGDVISVNGQATETQDAPAAKEDRGDEVFLSEPEAPATKEATAEPPASAEPPATDPPADRTDHGIPKARFNEVIGERNALKEQLAEANRIIESVRTSSAQPPAAAEPPAPAFDEMAMEKQYVEALMDGDYDKAAGIRTQINADIRDQAAQQIEARQAQAQAANAITSAAAQAVADYPYLDTEDGAEALELIIAARDSKAAKGMPMADALRAAVAMIAPKFAPVEGQTPHRGLTAQEAQTDTRPAAALARGAADSNLQPPVAQAGTGARAGAARVNVAELTEEQFENLSTADKRRLRGDL